MSTYLKISHVVFGGHEFIFHWSAKVLQFCHLSTYLSQMLLNLICSCHILSIRDFRYATARRSVGYHSGCMSGFGVPKTRSTKFQYVIKGSIWNWVEITCTPILLLEVFWFHWNLFLHYNVSILLCRSFLIFLTETIYYLLWRTEVSVLWWVLP